MSSKLDLLKRYGSAAANDTGKKKRKKKEGKSGSTIKLVDDSGFDNMPSAQQVKDAWEEIASDDEAPVIVDEKGVVVYQKAGTWGDVKLEHGIGVKKKQDPSPPRRKPSARNDSPSPPRRKPSARNDSPSPPRRPRNDSPSPPRRPRNDSPSPPRRTRNDSPSPPRRPRNDSPSPPRRKPSARNDSPSPPRRTRYDSPSPPRRKPSARNDSPSPPRRKPSARNDSPSPPRRKPSARNDSPSPPRRKPSARNDSPSPPRRKPSVDEDESSSSSAPKKRAKTASGHTAGLMNIKDFVEEDKLIRKKMMEDVAKASNGKEGQEETIYRDKRGRKLDMLNEMMRQQAIREGKEVAAAAEQYEWGKGSVQKEAEKLHAQELVNIASEPFARLKDDSKIDAHFREQIHADDPMAAYMMKKMEEKKKQVAKAKGLKPPKPSYKGPSPPPNRFNIPPGYRWDGRDRGNGWELRVLGQAAADKRTKDASYQWSVSDM